MIANFPANSTINYSCAVGNGQFWPTGGGTATAGVKTDASGGATFWTKDIYAGVAGYDIGCITPGSFVTVTVTVTIGSASASGSYPKS